MFVVSGCALSPPGLNNGSKAVTESALEKKKRPLTDEEIERDGEIIHQFMLGALLHELEDDWVSAQKAFTEVCDLDPGFTKACLKVVQLAWQAGNMAQAARYSEHVVRNDPDNWDYRRQLTRVYIGMKRYEEAIDHLTLLREQKPKSLGIPLEIAQLYGRMKRIDDARKILDPILSDGDVGWRAWLVLASAQKQAGQKEEALTSYEKAAELNPDSTEVLMSHALMLTRMKRLDDAEKLYRAYLKKHPDSPEIHRQLAGLLLKKNDGEGAVDSFRTLARLSGAESESAQIAAAVLLISQQHYELGLRELRLAEASNPDNPQVHYYLGLVLERLERPEEAKRYFEKIPPDFQHYRRAQLQLATIDLNSGKGGEAIKRLQKLLANNPDIDQLHLVLSDLLLHEGRYEETISATTKGLSRHPEQSRLLFTRAKALERSGRWKEAERDLKAYLKLKPDDAMALNYLGYSWAEQGTNLNASYELLKKAIKLLPENGPIVDSMGWVLYRLKRYKESLVMMEKAVRLEPKDPTIAEHLGDVLKALGDSKRALDAWRKALVLSAESTLEERAKIEARIKAKIKKMEKAP